MMYRHVFRLVVVVLVLASTAVAWSATGSASAEAKTFMVGESEIIECNGLERMAVGDPVVADVVAMSTREILVTAKSPGKTVLYVWDESGRVTYRLDVRPPELGMDSLCEEIKTALGDQRILISAVGNTIILEGTVSREAESSRAEAIARAAVENAVFRGARSGGKIQEQKATSRPEGDSFVVERIVQPRDASVTSEIGLRSPSIVNLIQVERALDDVSVRTLETASAVRQALNDPRLTVRALPGSVVIIEGRVGKDSEVAQVNQLISGWSKRGTDDTSSIDEIVTIVNAVEVDAAVARQVIVRAQVVDIDRTALKDFGVDWGRVVTRAGDVPGTVVREVQDQPWLIGQTDLSPVDLFGGGGILRFDPVGARIRALEQQNKARVLSQPNLLVLDGREASMLVGGEIPVPIVQSAQVGGAVGISVEYREFGVRLKIQPNITGDETVQLRVMPEVSSLDFSNAVVLSGFQIPAFRTRRTETTVNIADGQSLIIGGLLQNETAKLVRKIPLLGDLPIIGELFRTRSYVDGETELVIIITPQIVRPTQIGETQPGVGDQGGVPTLPPQ